MYIDKPLQKHTLIQTISRVNRVFDGKDTGLIVDYIGFKEEMLEAIKIYGSEHESPVDHIEASLGSFRNYLKKIYDLMYELDSSSFRYGDATLRLSILNKAVEFIQKSSALQSKFIQYTQRLKSAYSIVRASGVLSPDELVDAQFYLAARSILIKQTKDSVPDTEVMNQVVEEMIRKAITISGVENVIDLNESYDIFSDEFLKQLDGIDMPLTKYNALLKSLKKAVSNYGKTNKLKAVEFQARIRRIIDKYNKRDEYSFSKVDDFVNSLSDNLIALLRELADDVVSFQDLGISYKEKAFFDILIEIRNSNGFNYNDEQCLNLAKKIAELVDEKLQYADFFNRDDIKSQLNMDLTVLLYRNGYPPAWDEVVFDKVMEQVENLKINSV
jgi:type I restriction enzyme R subunit